MIVFFVIVSKHYLLYQRDKDVMCGWNAGGNEARLSPDTSNGGMREKLTVAYRLHRNLLLLYTVHRVVPA